MHKRKEMLLLTLLTLCNKMGGQFDFDINDKYFYDEEIIDCKLTLYLLLLTKQGEEQDKKYKEFEQKYIKLSKEKKEYIREELKKFLKNKIKIIKKRRKNYE